MGNDQGDLFEVIQLREWRARLTALVSGLFAFLAITGIFMYFGPFSVTAQVMVLLHTLVGLVFVVPYVMYQWHHWQTNRERPFNQHKLLGYLSLGAMTAVGISGLWLTVEAGWGRRISYAWDRVHLIGGLIVTVLVVWHLAIIMVRHVRQNAGEKAARMRAAQGVFLRRAVALLVVVGAITAVWVMLAPTMAVEGSFPVDYQLPFGDSPFAPSLATTASGGALVPQPLGNSERCGDANCHTQIVDEWLPSAHRYSSMSPFFQGVQAAMAANNGPESTRYCGGCHDPIALFAGLKNLYSEDLSGIGAQQGVSCVLCHSIESTDVRGNANYVVAAQPRYLHELSEQPLAAWAGRFLIRAYPRQHVDSFSRPLYREPEFCGACHKQFIDEEINNVGWVQLQNQYDTWRQSRWHAPDNVRETITCRECHMRLMDASTDPAAGDPEDYNRSDNDGKHRSHQFLAANQYLPTLLDLPGAQQHVALTEKWIRGEIEVPEIADKWTTGPAVPVQIVAPELVVPGEEVRLQVVSINNKPGHDFPTGPLDIIQAWIDVEVRDAAGNVVFSSGKLSEDNFLGADAIIFKAEAIDQYGNLIDRHNLWEMVGARFKRTLFPGYSDVADYSFTVPESLDGEAGELVVEAKLRYRKVDQYLVDFLFPDQGMTAAITDISEASARIRVDAAAPRTPETPER